MPKFNLHKFKLTNSSFALVSTLTVLSSPLSAILLSPSSLHFVIFLDSTLHSFDSRLQAYHRRKDFKLPPVCMLSFLFSLSIIFYLFPEKVIMLLVFCLDPKCWGNKGLLDVYFYLGFHRLSLFEVCVGDVFQVYHVYVEYELFRVDCRCDL